MVVAICDDDNKVVEKLEHLLKKNGVEEVLSFSTGIQLSDNIKGVYPFDLVIMDVEMPGINGIATARIIRELAPDAIIVILTKHQQYALEAYSIRPFTFMTKPVEEDSVVALLNEVRVRLRQRLSYTFSYGYKKVTLPVNGIRYIESFDWFLFLHYGAQVYKINDRMKNASEELSGLGFIRVHRSYLVNVSYIRSVDRQTYQMQLAGGEIIPISKHRIKYVAAAFFQERVGVMPW